MNTKVKAILWALLGFCCGVCLVAGISRLVTGGEPPLLDVLLIVAGVVLLIPLLVRVTRRHRSGAAGAGTANRDPQ